jgi:hypothetical protein
MYMAIAFGVFGLAVCALLAIGIHDKKKFLASRKTRNPNQQELFPRKAA